MLTPPHSFLISRTQSKNISLGDQKKYYISEVGTYFVSASSWALMKTVSWLIPVLFSLNLVFAACDERNRQPSTRTTPSPNASKINDDDLEKAVRTKLEEDTQLKEARSEEHTSELQSLRHLVCRLLLEK